MSEISETKGRFLRLKKVISEFFPLVHISDDEAWDMFVSSGGLREMTTKEMSDEIAKLNAKLNDIRNEKV